MSIAISVRSGPSKIGTLLMAIASTALIGVGAVALLQLFRDAAGVTAGIVISGVTLVVFACHVMRKRYGKITLMIAGDGQISLLRRRQGCFAGMDQLEIVQMMPDSTLWPFFILLRLRLQNKKVIAVPFFQGDLSPELFRRLSVACRWIAARKDGAQSPSPSCRQMNSDK
ncbi:MAG: hypothetical protein JWQ10_3635 [Herbaspirillum sp.]|nr:hypothetical protein [Herbaspirillum sp.]